MTAQVDMAEDDFKRGEAKAKLERIEQDVTEIKGDIKTVNVKIGDVEKAAQRAATKADVAVTKAQEQARIDTIRHDEINKNLESIKTKVNSIADKQTATEGRVAKIYTVAAVIGGGAGLVIPWLKDYFIK